MGLNREQIIDAALQMADAEGLDKLSMRRLAKALGVGTMSLYTHVTNKEDVVTAITDRVVDKFAIPSGPWHPSLRTMAINAHQTLLEHPWATAPMMSGPVGPQRLRFYDQILGVFRKAGFTKEQARRGFLSVDAHILGFALQESALPPPHVRQQAGQMFLQTLDPTDTPHMVDMVQDLIAGDDYATTFVYVLDLILDGLAWELGVPSTSL